MPPSSHAPVSPSEVHPSARRYELLHLLGGGGFGKVYHARLVTSDGFVKDVAVKVLHEEVERDEVSLKRFRDEARILGLIQDRAIVTVDPPTRLGGRWAVVMELVRGHDLKALIARGPLPPGVAVEIIGEVARALRRARDTVGPDGETLNLIHRDIKPENIKLTPGGEVKLLDFGLAKASFSLRESRTTKHIGGTIGYIPPERLRGTEGPPSDVYSLGVVLHEMLTGCRPDLDQDVGWSTSSGVRKVLALAEGMQRVEPSERPTVDMVERRCQELRRQLREPWLQQWAEESVLSDAEEESDELVGTSLTETLSSIPQATSAPLLAAPFGMEATSSPSSPSLLSPPPGPQRTALPSRESVPIPVGRAPSRSWPLLAALGSVGIVGMIALGGIILIVGLMLVVGLVRMQSHDVAPSDPPPEVVLETLLPVLDLEDLHPPELAPVEDPPAPAVKRPRTAAKTPLRTAAKTPSRPATKAREAPAEADVKPPILLSARPGKALLMITMRGESGTLVQIKGYPTKLVLPGVFTFIDVEPGRHRIKIRDLDDRQSIHPKFSIDVAEGQIWEVWYSEINPPQARLAQ